MDALDGDAKQEAADGDLGQDHGTTVEEVAVEPALSSFLDLPIFEITVVTTRTVVCSYCRRNSVSDEENLALVSDCADEVRSMSLTVEATMSQSSTPNAFTIFTRTIHRIVLAMMAVAKKAMLTPMSWGPRLSIAMVFGGGCLSHGP